MKRRNFIGLTIAGTAAMSLHPTNLSAMDTEMTSIRLGGPVFEKFSSPEEWVQLHKKLGSHIKSCHAKDIIIREDAAQTQMEEVRPGLGLLDYKTLLTELNKLPEVPLMIEHLHTAEEYQKSADYIRSTGNSLRLSL